VPAVVVYVTVTGQESDPPPGVVRTMEADAEPLDSPADTVSGDTLRALAEIRCDSRVFVI
jgi:hypothetical protein